MVHDEEEQSLIDLVHAHTGDTLPGLKQAVQGYIQSHASSLSTLDTVEVCVRQLDATKHTLPAMLLLAHLSQQKQQQEQDHQLVASLLDTSSQERFMQLAPPFVYAAEQRHCSFVPNAVKVVCADVRACALALRKGDCVLAPLLQCAKAVQTDEFCLTPVHAEFVHTCALTSCYKYAERLLPSATHPLTHADASVTAYDYLRYCYYGASCRIALSQLQDAKQLLLQAITAPASTLSAFAAAAYKKLILITLCLDGVQPHWPHHTPSAVQKGAPVHASSYMLFAEKLETNGFKAARELLHSESYMQEFADDGNLGLAKHALRSYRKHRIIKLGKIYSTLPLHKLAAELELADEDTAEQLIVQMADDGDIRAQINAQSATVEFEDPTNTFDSDDALRQLSSAVQCTFDLNSSIRSQHEGIAIDHTYLSKHQKAQQHSVVALDQPMEDDA